MRLCQARFFGSVPDETPRRRVDGSLADMKPAADWLAAWGTLTVAGIALAQPWAIQLYNWRFRRRKIILDRAARIECHFNANAGPFLMMKGIVFSENRRSLVTKMRAVVVRASNNSTQHFDLVTLRDDNFVLGASEQKIVQHIAGPFIVPKDELVDYYGIFTDAGLVSEVDKVKADLRNAWVTALQAKFGSLPTPKNDAEKDIRQRDIAALFQTFIANDPTHSRDKFLGTFIWYSGEYRLRIECDVRDDPRTFSRDWKFRLSIDDEARLRNNIPAIQQYICNLPMTSSMQNVLADYEDP